MIILREVSVEITIWGIGIITTTTEISSTFTSMASLIVMPTSSSRKPLRLVIATIAMDVASTIQDLFLIALSLALGRVLSFSTERTSLWVLIAELNESYSDGRPSRATWSKSSSTRTTNTLASLSRICLSFWK